MTKADLVDKIHANTGLTRDEAFAYLETVLETIKKTLETAETVKITGFGSFVVKEKKSRNARNLQTGEPITDIQSEHGPEERYQSSCADIRPIIVMTFHYTQGNKRGDGWFFR
jgi:integration host factor subunit alpha